MSRFKTVKKSFASLSNDVIQGFYLTANELAILLTCLSYPDDWKYRPIHLWKNLGISRNKTYEAFEGLVEKGHCIRVRSKNGNLNADVDYIFFDEISTCEAYVKENEKELSTCVKVDHKWNFKKSLRHPGPRDAEARVPGGREVNKKEGNKEDLIKKEKTTDDDPRARVGADAGAIDAAEYLDSELDALRTALDAAFPAVEQPAEIVSSKAAFQQLDIPPPPAISAKAKTGSQKGGAKAATQGGQYEYKAKAKSAVVEPVIKPDDFDGQLGSDRYVFNMQDGSHKVVSAGEVYTEAVQRRKNWTQSEIKQALAAVKNSCPIIRDWVQYIDGVIKNIRLKADFKQKVEQKQERTKTCQAQKQKSQMPNPAVLAPATEGLVSLGTVWTSKRQKQ